MMQRLLILFTRYPEAGRVKSRLISRLGEQGAAQVHRQLTEQTVSQMHPLTKQPGCQFRVRFTGADLLAMQSWLGGDLHFEPQGDGDLGERLGRAFAQAFFEGAQQVAVIGSDCPQLHLKHVQQAFTLLRDHDVVLGPARDGGYYLIALKSFYAPLFRNVAWGTSNVLSRTRTIAEQLHLQVAFLEELADIDRPEDLELWEESRGERIAKISVIVPTLNEEKILAHTLKQMGRPMVECIVVDGGSTDSTIDIAKRAGVKVLSSPAGRAQQMNLGAQAASGDILLFVHADTLLPEGFDQQIRRLLAKPRIVAGAFRLAIAGERLGLRAIEKLVAWRSRYLQLPYGDQALFMSRQIFLELGGFAALPIMEDFDFVRRLKKRGRIGLAPLPVSTSARRWVRLGVMQTTLLHQVLIIGYLAGVAPHKLLRWYKKRQALLMDGRC